MATQVRPIKRPASWAGFTVSAWILVALVFVQVFLAGWAILVNPAFWSVHADAGHAFGIPIFAMFLFSLAGRFPSRFALLSVGLYALYSLQYALLASPSGWVWMRALHPVNALVILLVAVRVARAAGSLQPGAPHQGS